MPQIRMRVLNEAVLQGSGRELNGIRPGTTVVEFYKNEEMIPFCRQEVNVYQNNSIQKIQLQLYADTMGVEYAQTVGAEFFPPDADDIAQSMSTQTLSAVVKVYSTKGAPPTAAELSPVIV